MDNIQRISEWLKVVGCAAAALAAAGYGTMFLLHSLGRWKGFKTAWPPQKFWATFPRRYSGWVAVGLAVLAIIFVVDFVSIVGETERSGDQVIEVLEGLIDSQLKGLVESHRTAVKGGRRDAWRQQIIDECRQNVETLVKIFPRTDEHLMKVDLLYCLQELTGVDLAMSPDQDLPPDALAARFATLQRKYKPPASGPSATEPPG